jgi:LmbE family N-acetylglucosaminyl deacetylase
MNAALSLHGRSLRQLVLLALACLLTAPLLAQVTPWQTAITASPDAQTLPEDRGADGLAQTLKKLHTWASLMMIVAHPDDEDGGMLTLESRGFGARTAVLTLTRGEGGQNAMSSETDDALGLIRTNELLLSDQYSGTEQFFSRVADYGFSKTIDEAHRQWGHDRVLYDVVRAVRLNRPQVISAVFVGGITDGHGHHQVSGEAAQEVFKLAGDPSVFPDQIAQGLRPWSPLKVYVRVPTFSISDKGMFDYATGKWAPVRFYDYVNQQWSDKVPSVDVEISEGNFDPILGRSYLQMSREGWSQQKSQNGGGNPPLPGPFDVSYHRYGSLVATTSPEKTIFDGIDTSLPGIATLAHGDTAFLVAALKEIDQHVMTATFGYLPANPEKIAPELAIGDQKTKALIDAVNASALSADDKANVIHELDIKLAQFNTALAEALGLRVNAFVVPKTPNRPSPFFFAAEETPTTVTPGAEFDVRLHVTSAGPWTTGGPLRLTRTWLEPSPNAQAERPWKIMRLGAPGMDVASSSSADAVYRVDVPHDAPYTRPYFTRPTPEQPYYDVSDPSLLNRPLGPYPLAGWAEFDYNGAAIRLGQVVQTVHREHGYGDLYQPLVVVPQISVNLASPAGIMPLGEAAFPLTISVKNSQQETAEGKLRLDLPAGWTTEPPAFQFHLRADEVTPVTFTVHPASLAAQSYTLKATAQSGNEVFSEGFETAGYPGLRPYFLYRPATYRARGVDLKVAPNLNVGYVMGTGDDVPMALEQIGARVHLLSAAELAAGDLSRYDAIVVGIRAYSNRPELAANNRRLLDYVQGGGALIVQYQSGGFGGYGPYPYSLGRAERVVDESAPVSLTGDPLLQWPNRITSADFDGWVEERGHSFLESWDSRYSAPTETHDPGQDPQRGGLISARYGKGIYMYVAYALYRQFPEAVPGAYRILADLVSAGKAPASK